MKKLLILFLLFPLFISCSDNKDDVQKDRLQNTIWTQNIGDRSFYLCFIDEKGVTYTDTNLGDDPSDLIWKSGLYYKKEKDNVRIYIFTGKMDENTGYAETKTLFTGYVRDNKLYLEGSFTNEGKQYLELTRYI